MVLEVFNLYQIYGESETFLNVSSHVVSVLLRHW